MKIFLSYTSHDEKVADEIQLALKGEGHEVFFDKDSLPPAGNYNARIRAAIKNSDAMVFLISANSLKEGSYTLTELKFARKKWPHPQRRVLAVVVTPTAKEIIDPYLKASTWMERNGNIAAEVAAEVAQGVLGGDEVDIIKTLTVVGDELQANQEKFVAADKERREVLAVYFAKISDCLSKVYEELNAGRIPHGNCAKLEGYAQMLESTVGHYIGSEKAKGLADLLLNAHMVETIYDPPNTPAEVKSRLPEIDRTAGTLGALADSVRAGLRFSK